MPFDSGAPLAQIVTILEGIAGVQEVTTGVPESFGHQVAAFVTLAGQTVRHFATNSLEREARYFVGLGYDVAGAEETAETTLAAIVDAFILAVYADKTLGGTVKSADLDLSPSNSPDYQPIAGAEFRMYPVLVLTKQYNEFNPSQ